MSAVDLILSKGPDRVMIDENEAVGWLRAKENYDITPDIIFIRNDGWSLGAPWRLKDAAEKLWSDCWVGVLIKPNSIPVTYIDYKKLKEGEINDRTQK